MMGGMEDNCGRCGSVIYPFSTRMAISDRQKYCIKCAEELDARYILKNSCSMCGRLMGKREVKFVLPSMAYGEVAMPLQERMACTPCYNKSLRKVRINMVRGERGTRGISTGIRKQIMGQLMKKKVDA